MFDWLRDSEFWLCLLRSLSILGLVACSISGDVAGAIVFSAFYLGAIIESSADDVREPLVSIKSHLRHEPLRRTAAGLSEAIHEARARNEAEGEDGPGGHQETGG